MTTIGVLHRSDFGDVPSGRGYERKDTDDEEDESKPVVPYDADHGGDRSRLAGGVAIPCDVVAETFLDALQQRGRDCVLMRRPSNEMLQFDMKFESLLAINTIGEMGGEFSERFLLEFIVEEPVEFLQRFGAVGHELFSPSGR